MTLDWPTWALSGETLVSSVMEKIQELSGVEKQIMYVLQETAGEEKSCDRACPKKMGAVSKPLR